MYFHFCHREEAFFLSSFFLSFFFSFVSFYVGPLFLNIMMHNSSARSRKKDRSNLFVHVCGKAYLPSVSLWVCEFNQDSLPFVL